MQTLQKYRKKNSARAREMQKFGLMIVAEANKKEFWYKKFMEYATGLKFIERFKLCWKILKKKEA